jgi:hypothetical protein
MWIFELIFDFILEFLMACLLGIKDFFDPKKKQNQEIKDQSE